MGLSFFCRCAKMSQMLREAPMVQRQNLRLIEAGSVILFYLQSLRVIFSVLFGILYDGLFEGPLGAWVFISVALIIAAFSAPVLAKFTQQQGWRPRLAILVALARVAMVVNDPQVRFWSALTILFAGGIYLGIVLRRVRWPTFRAVVLALVLDQLLRLSGDTFDLSLRSAWLPEQALWSLGLIIVAMRLQGDAARTGEGGGLRPWDGLALGAFLFLEISLLSLPNAIARWGDVPYAIVAPFLLAITLSFLVTALRIFLFEQVLVFTERRIVVGLILLAGVLAGYFASGVLAILGLLLVHMAALICLLGLIGAGGAETRTAGPAFSLGALLFLLLNFLNAFAFTYPYTLPIMRDLGWVVFLIASVILAAGFIWHRQMRGTTVSPMPRLIAALALVAAVLCIVFLWPHPPSPLPPGGELRACTYNIHYGYDDPWHYRLDAMADAIESNGCDFVALQEVDAGRLTSYAVDNAYYLARRLRMNAAYLPAVEHLTGIGLLYKGPAVPADARFLTSLQENTGVLRVEVDLAGQSFSFHAIWMGLSDEDTNRQIEEALAFIGDRSPAAFGGDFNAEFDEPVAKAVLAAGFDDPFTALGKIPAPFTSPAIHPDHRIDYVWVRGLTPRDAWVADSLASDHRMVVIEAGLSDP